MKKVVIFAALILTILSSILAGTLASYTVTLDHMASGSAVAKEFIFMEDGTDSFSDNIKIAPTEKVTWQFAVKNYDGSIVTETDLHYDLTFEVKAAPGKTAIAPLTVTIKDQGGNIVNSVTGTGTIHVSKDFPLSINGQSDAYKVEIYWPGTDHDINYAGNNFGTSINVSAVATQIPSGVNPQEPDPTPQSDVSVLFEDGTPWGGDGQPKYHNVRFTITNHSDKPITNWKLEFLYAEDIVNIWNARHDYEDLTTKQNRIIYPDQWHNSIGPGESVVFTGQVQGMGTEPVTSVTVNGVAVGLQSRYDLGTIW